MPCVGQSMGSPEHHLPLVMDQARVSLFVSGCGTRSKGHPEPQFAQREKGSSPGRNPRRRCQGWAEGAGREAGKRRFPPAAAPSCIPAHPRGCGLRDPGTEPGRGPGQQLPSRGGGQQSRLLLSAVPTPLKVSSRWRADYPLT